MKLSKKQREGLRMKFGRREFLASGKGKALVRMGLVSMSDDPIVFWFEKYQREGAA